jgi:hypothetical protein
MFSDLSNISTSFLPFNHFRNSEKIDIIILADATIIAIDSILIFILYFLLLINIFLYFFKIVYYNFYLVKLIANFHIFIFLFILNRRTDAFFLLSWNGCTADVPPRWAFVCGLLAAGWREHGVQRIPFFYFFILFLFFLSSS